MAATFYNPLVIAIDVAQGAPQTFTAMRPIQVLDASAYVTTAAAVATSVQVSSAGGNITNDFSLSNNAANFLGRAGNILATAGAIAVGATLTVTQTGAGTASRVSIVARAL